MSVQLKSILDQLEESKNRGKNFIKYHDLIDFETIKKLKNLGFKVLSNPYDECITVWGYEK